MSNFLSFFSFKFSLLRIFIFCFFLGFTFLYNQVRVGVGIGIYPSPIYYYDPWFYPYYPYYYPYYYGEFWDYPTALDLEIEQINHEYQEKIRQVRHQKDLSHADKKEQIQVLRYQKEKEILKAQQKYYQSLQEKKP